MRQTIRSVMKTELMTKTKCDMVMVKCDMMTTIMTDMVTTMKAEGWLSH